LPEPARNLVAAVYYVFHSVFNLFVISLFWAFMADHFRLEESKRLFPAIALGGSVGALVGSLISWQLVRTLGVNSLFLLAAALLEVAVFAAGRFCQIREPAAAPPGNNRPIGGSWFEGFEALYRSSYLRGVGLYEVLVGVASTFLYFTGLKLVAATTDSTAQQTALFAQINLWTQLATLAAQAFLAARVMRFAGVGAALALLPFLAIGGFTLLAVVPTLLVFTLVNAGFRAVQQGVSGPAQQTLFTVLSREDKYKAKALLDTVGYRTGDALGAYAERLLGMLGPGLYPVAGAVLGLSGLWLALCRFLGRSQAQLARVPSDGPEATQPPPP
jgi:AAA family ATP:ADP antiporter